MADAKKALVTGRLGKRLAFHGLQSFRDYFRMLKSGLHRRKCRWRWICSPPMKPIFSAKSSTSRFLRTQALRGKPQPFPGVERGQFQRGRGLQHGDGAGRLHAEHAVGILNADISTG